VEIPGNTKTLIEQWYDLASQNSTDKSAPSNIYFRFMALWVAFNALYDSRPWAYRKRDREQVELFSREDRRARDQHEELMRDDDEYRKAVYYLKKHQRDVDCELEDEQELKDVLLCVYKVRNNLFHARKLHGNLLDEELVRASHKILSELMLAESFLH
jgi:hypothetical protein